MIKEIKDISEKIKRLIKAEIEEKDLIDTGKLLKSIDVKINKNKDNFSIEVVGENYFKYLDKKFKIVESVMNKREYKSIEIEIIDLYYNYFIKKD